MERKKECHHFFMCKIRWKKVDTNSTDLMHMHATKMHLYAFQWTVTLKSYLQIKDIHIYIIISFHLAGRSFACKHIRMSNMKTMIRTIQFSKFEQRFTEVTQ